MNMDRTSQPIMCTQATTAMRKENRKLWQHCVTSKIIVMEAEPGDQLVRIYGDTAISNAEYTISVRESGQLKPRRIRLTDVFVRREGQWYLVAEQSTAIGK